MRPGARADGLGFPGTEEVLGVGGGTFSAESRSSRVPGAPAPGTSGLRLLLLSHRVLETPGDAGDKVTRGSRLGLRRHVLTYSKWTDVSSWLLLCLPPASGHTKKSCEQQRTRGPSGGRKGPFTPALGLRPLRDPPCPDQSCEGDRAGRPSGQPEAKAGRGASAGVKVGAHHRPRGCLEAA